MIYTSYFGALRRLPSNCIPVAICRFPPTWYKGLKFEPLMPKVEDFQEFRRSGNIEQFMRKYLVHTLNVLEPHAVQRELETLANKKDVALVCFEKPDDFCHRNVVSCWFEAAGIPCKEL